MSRKKADMEKRYLSLEMAAKIKWRTIANIKQLVKRGKLDSFNDGDVVWIEDNYKFWALPPGKMALAHM